MFTVIIGQGLTNDTTMYEMTQQPMRAKTIWLLHVRTRGIGKIPWRTEAGYQALWSRRGRKTTGLARARDLVYRSRVTGKAEQKENFPLLVSAFENPRHGRNIPCLKSPAPAYEPPSQHIRAGITPRLFQLWYLYCYILFIVFVIKGDVIKDQQPI